MKTTDLFRIAALLLTGLLSSTHASAVDYLFGRYARAQDETQRSVICAATHAAFVSRGEAWLIREAAFRSDAMKEMELVGRQAYLAEVQAQLVIRTQGETAARKAIADEKVWIVANEAELASVKQVTELIDGVCTPRYQTQRKDKTLEGLDLNAISQRMREEFADRVIAGVEAGQDARRREFEAEEAARRKREAKQ